MTKLLVIGLDGATLDLIEPWAKAGKLPVLQNMMENGCYGRLRSVLPVLSSSAWASFMTGMNPGKHGFYDFVRREPGGYRLRLLRRDHLNGKTLWQLLSQAGRQVGVINVPMTYPPEQVNGLLVTGLGTPDYKPFTYPEELGPELLRNGYRVNKQVPYRPGAERAFLKEVYETTEELTRNTLHLMDRVDWEFFMVVYRDTDEMHHFFWKHMDSTHPAHDPAISAPYRDAILEYYQKIDATIGRLLAKAGPEATVWIMSDHGGGPLYQDVFLNEWLRQKNYLTIHSEQQPTGKARNALGRLGVTRANVSSMLRRLRLGRLERWLKDQLGDRIEVLPRSQRAEFPQAIDWSRTQAYSFGYHGQVYLNLQGREPQGIVPPGVYEAVREKIAADLLGMIDPRDGKPVVDQVYRREDIYHGPFLDYAPDLTLVMRNYSYVTRQGYEFSDHPGSIFSSPLTHESGSHRMDGVVVAYGEGIKALGKLSKGANLVDLAPTLLHLCSCSIPAMMDGHVLADWLTTSHPPVIETDAGEATISPAELPTFSEAEEAEMINRLKNLGYLE